MYQPSVKCNNVVQFYKCQSETFSLDNEYDSNLFMFEEKIWSSYQLQVLS